MPMRLESRVEVAVNNGLGVNLDHDEALNFAGMIIALLKIRDGTSGAGAKRLAAMALARITDKDGSYATR